MLCGWRLEDVRIAKVVYKEPTAAVGVEGETPKIAWSGNRPQKKKCIEPPFVVVMNLNSD